TLPTTDSGSALEETKAMRVRSDRSRLRQKAGEEPETRLLAKAATRGRRPGFTLVEMLVVVTILLVLAGITVLFAPKMMERQRADKGAEQFMEVLLLTKQKAVRDRAARGV